MRRILTIVIALAVVRALARWAVAIWLGNRRIGTGFVNTVVNPLLLRRGLAGGRASEIGRLEHVGRRSGTRRLTLVHPEQTPDGFRIMVPLAGESQWARNVLAAGHCRLQLHELVYELDEPVMVPASQVADLPVVVRRVTSWLGFEYLVLHRFAVAPGTLDVAETERATPVEPSFEPAPTEPGEREVVAVPA